MNPDISSLQAIVSQFSDVRVLCLGDIMLDRFLYGHVDRISPESPVPIFTYGHETLMLGGAGNVVRNVASLGGKSSLVAAIGSDATGHTLTKLVGEEVGVVPYLMSESSRISTEKTRYIASSQQLLRADRETTAPISAVTASRMMDVVSSELTQHQVVVLSDYGKGVLTRAMVADIMHAAQQNGLPVLVDPKQRDFGYYAGASIISPNLKEFLQAARLESDASEEDMVAAARRLCEDHSLGALLITRGKDGMMLCSADGLLGTVPAVAHEVFDVSGAGDTALAALALSIGSGADSVQAMRIANEAAGIAVTKLGTAVVFGDEVMLALTQHDYPNAARRKIMQVNHAKDLVKRWREQNLCVGFTNGCFDIMHAGHATVLADAKSRCDKLVVAVNTDASVKRLKGASRPVNREEDRAHLLASLSAVDVVVLFDDDTPLALIKSLQPDVLMKGADYTREQVVGHDVVESYGGRVELLPLKEGYSTTGIIKKMAAQ